MCKKCLIMFILFVAAVIVAVFFIVRSARGETTSVVINEIAWMGTAISVNDEWIELYNTSATPVDLTGWTLAAEDGSPTITLAGSIDAGGYFLLERTDDTSVVTIPANMLYSGSLSNGGELLRLSDSSGAPVYSVNGWTAGDNKTKLTMARDADGTWRDGIAGGTPKTVNMFSAIVQPIAKQTPPNTTQPVTQRIVQNEITDAKTVNEPVQKQKILVDVAQQSAINTDALLLLGVAALTSAAAGGTMTYLHSRRTSQ